MRDSGLPILILIIVTLGFAVAPAQAESPYTKAPREITSEAKFLALKRFAYTGQMKEAESRAADLLNLGYRGSRYECNIHETLAAGYEKLGDHKNATAAWNRVLLCSDPRMGSYIAAENKIRRSGGTPPPRPVVSRVESTPARAPRIDPVRSDAQRLDSARSGASSPLKASLLPARSHAPSRATVSANSTAPVAYTAPSQNSGSASTTRSDWQPRVFEPAPTRNSSQAGARLAAEGEFQRAQQELEGGSYPDLRMAVKRLESLLIDRGYEGSADGPVLHVLLADAYRGLAQQHAAWAAAR